MLGREGSDIDVAEIIDAVSESLDSTKCQGKGDCRGGEICLTHHLWEDLSKQIHGFLSNITLADLVSKREIEEIARNQNERITQMQASEQCQAANRPAQADTQDENRATISNLELIAASSR